eukprot:PhF_6_TR35002/c0_g1_i3/m.50905
MSRFQLALGGILTVATALWFVSSGNAFESPSHTAYVAPSVPRFTTTERVTDPAEIGVDETLASQSRPQSHSGVGGGECSHSTSCGKCVLSPQCVWCASTGVCIPKESPEKDTCEDVEDTSCPAILLGPLPMNIRVIHVGIRKGGPEALVQMHLALVHWGFKSTLDTRKHKPSKGGDVVPFFKQVYAKDFEKSPPLRWFQTYDDWLTTGVDGDVFLETETWPCKQGLRFEQKGVRQMQWHLTVWAKKDRRDCFIAAHTRYIAAEYMELPRRAVMFPYISPNIIALSKTKPSWKDQKTNLVMYDADSHLKPEDFTQTKVKHELKLATGMTPDQLYSQYMKAKVGIDIAMPGAERFVYEASLFGVCIVVDLALNGKDEEDLPIPNRFRVPSNDLAALNARKDECLQDYDTVIEEFTPLRNHVLKQRVNFYRQVRQYYSNNIHVVTSACDEASAAHTASFILSVFFQVPFATIEVFVAEGIEWAEPKIATDLRDRSYLASVHIHIVPKTRCPSKDVLFKTKVHSSTAQRSKFIAWMDITHRLVRPDFVSYLATEM